MSDYLGPHYRDRPWLRRAVVLLAVALGLALVVAGGSLLRPESAAPSAAPSAVVGRTSAVCSVPTAGDATASPAPADSPTPTAPADGASAGEAPSTVSAVAVRQAGSSGGTLTGAPLGSPAGDLSVTDPGTGAALPAVTAPVVLTAEGAMATAAGGAVSSTATTGESAGLMAAPCLLPSTEQWFVGVGSADFDRTELILTNPDDAQAEVDLRFYGRNGRVVVPGSPGVVIGAMSTRTVSVASLVDGPGPISVAVRASEGRVSVAARRLRTADLKPAGAEWQVPSTAPATSSVIAGVPGGPGSRILSVVNPSTTRATVQVEVLGLTGAIVPADAASLEVPAESTATVDLAAGMAGESGSIRLRSSTAVTGAVVATSTRAGSGTDIAVESAAPPLVSSGVSALATTTGDVASELVLSNGGDTDAPVTFEVFSYAGVSLRRDDILLGVGTTATRRLTSPGPSYVVVTVPPASAVVGSVTLTQPEGPVAGLTTVPLISPDVASRAPRVQQDPAVGR